jgi:hypothetical protein
MYNIFSHFAFRSSKHTPVMLSIQLFPALMPFLSIACLPRRLALAADPLFETTFVIGRSHSHVGVALGNGSDATLTQRYPLTTDGTNADTAHSITTYPEE